MRQLTLIRHATATRYIDAESDAGRHLTAAGQGEARALGKHLAKRSDRPSHWLVSSATRTQETARAIGLALREEPSPHWLEPRLYLAESSAIVELMRTLPSDCTHAVIVAHNPGITDLYRHLLDQPTAPTLEPATCITLISPQAAWSDTGAGDFKLSERWQPPRGE